MLVNYYAFLNLGCRTKLVGVKKKLERREATRERKALSAAHLERSIEKELLERLKSKAYGDAPLNVNEEVWQAVLNKSRGKEDEDEAAEGLEDMEDDETEEELEKELEMEDDDDWGEREFVSDISGDESEDGFDDLVDMEDAENASESDDTSDAESSRRGSTKGKRKAPPIPRKPAKTRPEKKAKRLSRPLLYAHILTLASDLQADLTWKLNTSKNSNQHTAQYSLHSSLFFSLQSPVYTFCIFISMVLRLAGNHHLFV